MRTLHLCQRLGLSILLFGMVMGMLSASAAALPLATQFESPLEPQLAPLALTPRAYLPLISRALGSGSACTPTGQTYGQLAPFEPATGDMSKHPDVNLAVRGYESTTAYLGLVDYTGNVDPNAPQLYTLFANGRTPVFTSAYRVYRWDWTCNCRGGPITKWDVTLLGMRTTAGETIHLPVAGYDIGGGYGALVLYAEPTRLTLKYTRDDDVVEGYTIHLENVCVDANLLAKYRSLNAAGRGELPALWPGQALGRASGTQIHAAIRDTGSFLDPRSRKDWWQGR